MKGGGRCGRAPHVRARPGPQRPPGWSGRSVPARAPGRPAPAERDFRLSRAGPPPPTLMGTSDAPVATHRALSGRRVGAYLFVANEERSSDVRRLELLPVLNELLALSPGKIDAASLGNDEEPLPDQSFEAFKARRSSPLRAGGVEPGAALQPVEGVPLRRQGSPSTTSGSLRRQAVPPGRLTGPASIDARSPERPACVSGPACQAFAERMAGGLPGGNR